MRSVDINEVCGAMEENPYIDCMVPDCGAIKYVRRFQDFEFNEKKFLKDRPKVLWLNPKRKKSISDEWLKEIEYRHN
ncbi:MAG: hypothetical protein U9R01_02060 [candidate division WOR-3 bacterium]|nr:hypothetical protein [candidate division WOR-3 bacterium]